jgi:alkylation response protein AidB-like acyl-CoA dehydrogenase
VPSLHSVERQRQTSARVRERLIEVIPALARLPLPGHGDTWERFEILASLAEEDLSLARLGEGHADALAILNESGHGSRYPGSGYGVWAARSGTDGVTAEPVPGGWILRGRKPFCSGSGVLDRALITAEAPDGYRLFDIATVDSVIDTIPESWPAVGMAASLSETLTIGGPVVADEHAIGPPGYYTDRPGFWFGACGVAACWYGGARGLVAGVLEAIGGDSGELALMEVGKSLSGLQGMRDSLRSVARAIDADPEDKRDQARMRALAVRQIVHDACEEILRRTAAAGGARPLCHDPAQARRAADLYVYLAQHHGGADAASLGRLAVEGGRR